MLGLSRLLILFKSETFLVVFFSPVHSFAFIFYVLHLLYRNKYLFLIEQFNLLDHLHLHDTVFISHRCGTTSSICS